MTGTGERRHWVWLARFAAALAGKHDLPARERADCGSGGHIRCVRRESRARRAVAAASGEWREVRALPCMHLDEAGPVGSACCKEGPPRSSRSARRWFSGCGALRLCHETVDRVRDGVGRGQRLLQDKVHRGARGARGGGFQVAAHCAFAMKLWTGFVMGSVVGSACGKGRGQRLREGRSTAELAERAEVVFKLRRIASLP